VLHFSGDETFCTRYNSDIVYLPLISLINIYAFLTKAKHGSSLQPFVTAASSIYPAKVAQLACLLTPYFNKIKMQAASAHCLLLDVWILTTL
jgi:hypothetical protein